MTSDLAVVIPHYKDQRRLEICLDILAKCEGRFWTDVVVVHSGDTHHDPELSRRHPNVRFLNEPVLGAGPARNTGVAATSAPFLLFIDSDCRPAKDLLIQARRHVNDADIVGGRIDLFDETPGQRSGAEAFEAVFAFRQRVYIARKHFAATANLLTTRDVFTDVGPFAASLSEDREWCLRARSKSHSIAYCADMRVKHPSRGTWLSLIRKWDRLLREDYATGAGTTAFELIWRLKLVAMPLSTLIDIPKIWFSLRLNGPSERARGSWTLIKLRLWRMRLMLALLSVSRAHKRRHSA